MSKLNYWLDSNFIRPKQKDIEKIKSMINSLEINIKVVKNIALDNDTATIIYRETYESIRQLGDAKLWSLGFEPLNHEVSMEILKDFDIKSKILLNSLDRFKKMRHDINYRGFRASVSQAREILDFWDKCCIEILSQLKKEYLY